VVARSPILHPEGKSLAKRVIKSKDNKRVLALIINKADVILRSVCVAKKNEYFD